MSETKAEDGATGTLAIDEPEPKPQVEDEFNPFFTPRERLLIKFGNEIAKKNIKKAQDAMDDLGLQDLRADALEEAAELLGNVLDRAAAGKQPIPAGCRPVAHLGLQFLYNKTHKQRDDAEKVGAATSLLQDFDKQLSEIKRLDDAVRGQLGLPGIVPPAPKSDEEK